jgi:hypothetical protein
VIDGEAVLLGVDGWSDFNGLHSRKRDDELRFYAFDAHKWGVFNARSHLGAIRASPA